MRESLIQECTFGGGDIHQRDASPQLIDSDEVVPRHGCNECEIFCAGNNELTCGEIVRIQAPARVTVRLGSGYGDGAHSPAGGETSLAGSTPCT
jgi:hypothetical protein